MESFLGATDLGTMTSSSELWLVDVSSVDVADFSWPSSSGSLDGLARISLSEEAEPDSEELEDNKGSLASGFGALTW